MMEIQHAVIIEHLISVETHKVVKQQLLKVCFFLITVDPDNLSLMIFFRKVTCWVKLVFFQKV